jgi:hypothetical protein
MSAKIPGLGSLTDLKTQASNLYDQGKAVMTQRKTRRTNSLMR